MATVSGAADNTPAIESSAFQAEHLDMLKTATETGDKITVTENGHTLLSLTVTKPKTQKPKNPSWMPTIISSYPVVTS